MNRTLASKLRRYQELIADIERMEIAFRVYRAARGCERAADRVGRELVASKAMLERIDWEAA